MGWEELMVKAAAAGVGSLVEEWVAAVSAAATEVAAGREVAEAAGKLPHSSHHSRSLSAMSHSKTRTKPDRRS